MIQVLVCKYVTVTLKRHFTAFFPWGAGGGGDNLRAQNIQTQVLAPLQNSPPRIPSEDPLDKGCQVTGNH